MRRLLLFLLVINVVYFTWQLSMHDESEGMIGSTVENIEPIFLLSERERLPIADLQVVESLVVEGQSTEGRAAERQAAESKAVEDHVTENQATEDTGAQPELSGVKQSEVELHLSEEHLSGISGGEKTDNVEERVEADIKIASETASIDACFTAGPFNDLEALRTLIDDLKNNVTDTKIRDQEEKELSVYWVYINPEKNRKDAKTLGQNLKAKKIKDFYIIRSGEKNNGISLGHFKSKYRATKLTRRVKNLGFDVKIEPVFKAYTVYWLNYQMAKNESMPQNFFNKYEKFAVNNKVALLRRDCATK